MSGGLRGFGQGPWRASRVSGVLGGLRGVEGGTGEEGAEDLVMRFVLMRRMDPITGSQSAVKKESRIFCVEERLS